MAHRDSTPTLAVRADFGRRAPVADASASTAEADRSLDEVPEQSGLYDTAAHGSEAHPSSYGATTESPRRSSHRAPEAREVSDVVSMRVVLAVFLAGAAWVFLPFLPWLVLAAWVAGLARPWAQSLSTKLGGRSRAASVIIFGLLLVLAVPVALIVVALASDLRELAAQVSNGTQQVSLAALVSTGGGASGHGVGGLRQWLMSHGSEAFTVLSDMTGVAADVGAGLFVFVSGTFVLLTEGSRAYGWFLLNAPVADRHLARFGAAFQETGRGLIVGIGLTGLVQATIATIAYVWLGVPRALILGLVTFLASAIPSVGTALVWVPVAIGLASQGRTSDAIWLSVIGILFVSTADNLLRPMLSRWARLDLHPFVVLVAMFGGLGVMGGWGLLLGPLVVRLAVEALRIARSERIVPSVF